MNLVFAKDAWEDYLYWQQTDKNKLKRINLLIKSCLQDPMNGIGKPEALRFDMSGFWSRRIDTEHRLVYKVDEKNLIIIQCRYHY